MFSITDQLYAINFENPEAKIDGNILSYNGEYQLSDKIMDLRITSTINFGDEYKEKELKFSYKNTEYTIPVFYNTNILKFLDEYPRVELDLHFNAATDRLTSSTIIKVFKEILKEKTKAESLEIIFRFAQTAFG